MEHWRAISEERKWQEERAERRSFWNRLLYDSPAFDALVGSQISYFEFEPDCWVLDLGCGEGRHLTEIAERGARVVGVDISLARLSMAKERVKGAWADSVSLVQADALALPFASATFPAIFGKAILHHLDDRNMAASEILRVLRPGGRIAFAEPMSAHPIFWLVRRLTPGLRHAREKPFQVGDFQRFASPFQGAQIETWFLLTPLAYLFRLFGLETLFRKVHAILCRLDAWLFHRFSFLRMLAWYGVVKAQKPSHDERE
jgi:SAM-dependent methyltransferase